MKKIRLTLPADLAAYPPNTNKKQKAEIDAKIVTQLEARGYAVIRRTDGLLHAYATTDGDRFEPADELLQEIWTKVTGLEPEPEKPKDTPPAPQGEKPAEVPAPPAPQPLPPLKGGK